MNFIRRKLRPLLLIAILVSAAALYFLRPEAVGPISPEERNARLQQQQIVATWHKKYQHTIDTLDHTWKRYHLVISDFNEDLIDLDEAHERLLYLDRQSTATLDALTASEPPAGLDTTNFELVLAVLQKTRAYAKSQQQTIHLSATAADPERQLSEVQAEQSRILQEIMIREAPAGLFTANEISALRSNVTVPE